MSLSCFSYACWTHQGAFWKAWASIGQGNIQSSSRGVPVDVWFWRGREGLADRIAKRWRINGRALDRAETWAKHGRWTSAFPISHLLVGFLVNYNVLFPEDREPLCEFRVQLRAALVCWPVPDVNCEIGYGVWDNAPFIITTRDTQTHQTHTSFLKQLLYHWERIPLLFRSPSTLISPNFSEVNFLPLSYPVPCTVWTYMG